MMGAYHETLAFLRTLGTDDQVFFQRNLEVHMVRPGGARVDAPVSLMDLMLGDSRDDPGAQDRIIRVAAVDTTRLCTGHEQRFDSGSDQHRPGNPCLA